MSRDVLTRPAPAPTRTERFGPRPTQVYDVWAPPAAEVTVVLVHGGFWRAEWDRAHLHPMANGLAEAGYAVALPEYRRTGMPGGTWPAPGDDVAAALAAIRADEDLPDQVVLVGHSAGAHLAVWLLHHPEAVGVLGAVSLAGCLDLREVGRLGLDDGAADALMGGDDSSAEAHWTDKPHRSTEPHWTDEPHLGADPCDLGPTPVPVLLVHGRDDELVPLSISESWLDRAGTPGRDRLTVLDDADHFDLVDPRAGAWSTVLAQVAQLAQLATGVSTEETR